MRYNFNSFVTKNLIKMMIRSTAKSAATELSLALHALQDSFSSGHTLREKYTDINKPGAIEDIYIYSNQNTDHHSEQDYLSASENSVFGRSAIAASADLMYMCTRSVTAKSVTSLDWKSFEKKWLQLSRKAK